MLFRSYSLGGPEAGSEPFFFPKFPVQSTMSLWITTADMAARPGADRAWRRVRPTWGERSGRLRAHVSFSPPGPSTPCTQRHPLHTARPVSLPSVLPASGWKGALVSLQTSGCQTMSRGVGHHPAAIRADPLESVLYVRFPHKTFVQRNISLEI